MSGRRPICSSYNNVVLCTLYYIIVVYILLSPVHIRMYWAMTGLYSLTGRYSHALLHMLQHRVYPAAAATRLGNALIYNDLARRIWCDSSKYDRVGSSFARLYTTRVLPIRKLYYILSATNAGDIGCRGFEISHDNENLHYLEVHRNTSWTSLV